MDAPFVECCRPFPLEIAGTNRDRAGTTIDYLGGLRDKLPVPIFPGDTKPDGTHLNGLKHPDDVFNYRSPSRDGLPRAAASRANGSACSALAAPGGTAEHAGFRVLPAHRSRSARPHRRRIILESSFSLARRDLGEG